MFRKYEYVYAVYREQSFTKAAQSLYISQPSLSVAIQNLEKEIGAPLFDRTGSQIVPTEIGRAYIAAAEKIMQVERDFSQRVQDICGLNTGSVSVGGTNYLCSYVLPRIVTQFTAMYPKIEVSLVEGNSQSLQEMLEHDRLDLLVDSFDEMPASCEGVSLSHERILLCVPADRAINTKLTPFCIYPDSIYNGTVDLDAVPPVPIEAFRDEQFVLLKEGNDMYARAMRVFQKSGITPHMLFRVDQMNISYALADSGMGVCFATDTLFRYGKFHNNVLLYNVGEEHGTRTLYAVHKKNRYRSHSMAEFVRIAKEVIGR